MNDLCKCGKGKNAEVHNPRWPEGHHFSPVDEPRENLFDTCAVCGARRYAWPHIYPMSFASSDHPFVPRGGVVVSAQDCTITMPYGDVLKPDPKRVWLNDVRPAPKPKNNTLYLMGSLRNPNVPDVGNKLRAAGWDVYDDWFAGGPEADDRWKDYELARGHNFIEALGSHTAHNIFHFDTLHIERCAVGVLLMPAGKSAHLELGDGFTGRGKPGYIITDDPDRFDVMYRFASGVFADVEAFIETVKP